MGNGSQASPPAPGGSALPSRPKHQDHPPHFFGHPPPVGVGPLSHRFASVPLCLPQALIYPLTVASKSTTTARHNAANKILKNMCEHSNTLVQQAMMVSREPVRGFAGPGRLAAGLE